ncbi:MAG TPA: outer membrane beta-barrel protein [Vicinamibacterales bacterium]|nr:outer membrane beta-barrel protein [Vicinamibacterales bacterium]
MRHIRYAVLVWAALGGVAAAQSPTAADDSRGYIEGVAQSAFGNVTSQSFGGEIGVKVRPGLQVFVDGGYVRDTTPGALSSRAQSIAADISTKAGGGTYRVKQPVTFGVAGIKYWLPVDQSRFAPYVMFGGGMARVQEDTTFTVATGNVSDYVAVGSDLVGTQTKGMISGGVGVDVAVGRSFYVDLQYRFGRVFTTDGLNINRAGAGVGVRF